MYGSILGGFIALSLTVFLAGRTSLGALENADATPSLIVSSGALYLAVVVFGALAGIALTALVYAYGREADPGPARFPLRYLFPAGAVTSAIFSYAILRFGIGAWGDISDGTVTIAVDRLTVVAVVIGLVTGALTASVVDALARPEFMRFEGEARPESRAAVMADMMRAVGIPMVAVTVAAIFAFLLSRVLLNLQPAAAVIVFSMVAALVLGGAAFIAARPRETDKPAEPS